MLTTAPQGESSRHKCEARGKLPFRVPKQKKISSRKANRKTACSPLSPPCSLDCSTTRAGGPQMKVDESDEDDAFVVQRHRLPRRDATAHQAPGDVPEAAGCGYTRMVETSGPVQPGSGRIVRKTTTTSTSAEPLQGRGTPLLFTLQNKPQAANKLREYVEEQPDKILELLEKGLSQLDGWHKT